MSSGRGADGMGDNGERRGGAGQRVHFEALVAVGGAENGAGFEAESVDVSLEGMRLRAAYLPELGDKLLCRFDGPGGEVLAEGEVCWRNDEARGGEFGLRFVGLDAAAEEAVREMCAALGGPAEPAAGRDAGKGAGGGGQAADRGARVRLHIEGLGSPMKARVRSGGEESVEVGSNLEFLKVGRSLEIEDVERGARREVYIDEVKVEVDPATSIPQLVVTLRPQGSAPGAARAKAMRAGSGAATAGAATAGAAAAGAAAAGAAEVAAAGARKTAHASRQAAAAVTTRAGAGSVTGAGVGAGAGADAEADAGAVDEGDEGDLSPALEAGEHEVGQESPQPVEARPSAASAVVGLRAMGGKAARAGAAVAGKLGPALSDAGSKMKSAMTSIAARVQQRRAERAGEAEGDDAGKRAAGPRRMTAPPPTGALRSEGRRLVRDDEGEDGDETPAPKPAVNKKAAAIGSFLGLAAVLAVFGVTRILGLHGGGETAQAPALSAAHPSDTAAALAPGAQPLAPGAQPAGGGPVSANVPLFGATPLSTTEAVPPPAPPVDPANAGAALDPGALMPGAEPGDEPSAGEGGDGDGDPKSWGQGTVRNPVVLKLKMDGAIGALNGAAGPMGFTVSLPDRRALSSGSDLARKDKRIASLRVVNTALGAEVTLQFKDGVPAYTAKANGNRLEIALGNDDGPKKVAAKAKKAKKAKDSKASKDDKGKKPQKKGGKEKKPAD